MDTVSAPESRAAGSVEAPALTPAEPPIEWGGRIVVIGYLLAFGLFVLTWLVKLPFSLFRD
jgi:hypothetical protein